MLDSGGCSSARGQSYDTGQRRLQSDAGLLSWLLLLLLLLLLLSFAALQTTTKPRNDDKRNGGERHENNGRDDGGYRFTRQGATSSHRI